MKKGQVSFPVRLQSEKMPVPFFLFQEFVRLQIGNQWYVVSDPLPWNVKQKLILSGGQWIDNNSSVGQGN